MTSESDPIQPGTEGTGTAASGAAPPDRDEPTATAPREPTGEAVSGDADSPLTEPSEPVEPDDGGPRYRWVPWLVTFCLLLPLCFSYPESGDPYGVGMPRVYRGDEAHYLLMINSVLADRDLDVRNNYENVWEGGHDGGVRTAHYGLHPHIAWYHEEGLSLWRDRYRTEYIPEAPGYRFVPDGAGPLAPEDAPWRSWHPGVFALVMGGLLLPFAHTGLIEPLALLFNALFLVGAMWMFRALVHRYASRGLAEFTVACAFLGTPAWHYGRALFTEGLILFCIVGAFTAALAWRRGLIAGLFSGLAITLKPLVLLAAAPIGLLWLLRRQWRPLGRFIAGNTIFVVFLMACWTRWFGGPLRAPLPWASGDPIEGLRIIFLSLDASVLLFAPMTVIALFTWPAAIRRHGMEACAILAGFLCYFIPFVFYEAPVGNLAYGPRYQTVVLPLLTFGLVGLGYPDPVTRFWSRTQIALVALFAIAANAAGALPYWHSWNGHPLLGEGEAPVCLSGCDSEVFELEYEVARNLQVDGHVAASLPLLERLSQTHSGERDIDFLLGFALQTADRSQEAATAYVRYLSRNPDDRLTHFNLGYAYLNLGQWGDCVTAFERSLELAPDRREADTPLRICRDQMQ